MKDDTLPLPDLLVELIRTGRWAHPGAAKLRAAVPCIEDELVFLGSEQIPGTRAWALMGPEEHENAMFAEYRSSRAEPRDLPWIDVEMKLFVMCNKVPGDDCGVALDYRTGLARPRVIASDWSAGRLRYREIAPSIEGLVETLGI